MGGYLRMPTPTHSKVERFRVITIKINKNKLAKQFNKHLWCDRGLHESLTGLQKIGFSINVNNLKELRVYNIYTKAYVCII